MRIGETWTTLKRALLPGALFGLAFCLTAAGLSLTLRAAAPSPYFVVLSDKLIAFDEGVESYDTVFIGTSRTFYHIDPAAIETGAEGAGCPGLNVYNFGVYGLTGAEQDWLIDYVLERGQGYLKTIIIEDPLPGERTIDAVTSARVRQSFGPENYAAIAANIASFPESLPKRIFRTGIAGYGVLYDLSGVGRASSLVFPEINPLRPKPERGGVEGLGSLEENQTQDIIRRREDFLARPEAFTQALASQNLPPEPNVEARAAYLEKRLRLIESYGKTAALYVSPDPPELNRTAHVGRALATRAPDLTVFNYNDPATYPELFERELWFDFSHFKADAASNFSLQVGADLCDLKRSVAAP